MHKTSNSRLCLLRFCILLTAVMTACTASLAQDQEMGNREPPKVGVRIIEITEAGQLDRAGIQVMDLLSKYGKFEVVDHSTYYKAREFYLKTPDKKVKVQFWRGRTPMTIEVLPGGIGGSTNEYNVVAYQLDSAMMHVNTLKDIPEYLRPVEFKPQFENGGLQDALSKASEIIDRAEGEGTLTPTQILVGRMGLILDNAPEEDVKKLEILAAEFVRSQPAEYIGWLGEEFREKSHYRAARLLLKAYLLNDPDNISLRLNLGQACLALGLWSEAEAGADLVLSTGDELSPHGLFVVYQQKAVIALSKNDYNTSIEFSEKAFEINGGTTELLLIQLAAAFSGNVEKFNDASQRYKQVNPKEFESFKLQIDSAEALALATSGHDELAREVVARSTQKDRVEGRLKNYWKWYPHGNKVVENWMRLMKS